jgi:HAD superfamily hydrolase (TIGR01549 family)
MIKGYIFDYGGTLDTAGCHWGKMLWHAYERQGVGVSEKQFREAYVYGERTLGSTPIIQSDYTFHKTLDVKIRLEMEQLCTSGAWGADEREFREKHDAVLDDLYARVQDTTRHSKKVLETLAGQYPMVLVSNFYGNIEVVLKEFGLDGLFQDVIESAVVGIRKPDPRIFSLGVKSLKLAPEEVMVVGDSYYKDIQPALRAGCHAIWLKGEGWTDQEYDESVPDRVITDLDQLLE